MTRDTLLDFFEDFSTRTDTFIVHDDGYRVRRTSYRDVADAARTLASALAREGVGAGDRICIWSENRTEWIVAFWACLLARSVVVPVDFRASGDLLARISGIVKARVVFVGAEVDVPDGVTGRIWPLADAVTLAASRAGVAPAARPTDRADIDGTALAEIIFTSGATADPKGVTITHRNVLANIIPIEREIGKYRRYVWPFHPLRFLNLLPLSHMFGQSMATFVPPMLSGTVVFSHGYSPAEIIRQVGTRRVSVLVCVPKVLDVLRDHVQRLFPHTADPDPLAGMHWSRRWWHYRDVHRLFGWKFWCIVCGAAPLDADLEAFWRKLGFLVVQGYGLTETAPIVTLNHPLRASKGTVGTPIGGVKVKIADDGEILVQGENVTQGYYRPEGTDDVAAAEANAAFRDGWFHTGDIGEIDANGRLLIKGRKKEMIVTPQGLNVFPEDVERALLQQPGVNDAAVVGRPVDGEERIHAVLVIDDTADVNAIVRGANAGLEDHQRVWSSSVWTAGPLPRTEGTQKLKRKDLQRWVSGEAPAHGRGAGPATSLADIIGRHVAGRTLEPGTTLEELGLSSLDRVELMMELEAAFHTTLDESMLTGSRSLRDLEALLTGIDAGSATPRQPPAGAKVGHDGAVDARTGDVGNAGARRPAQAVDTTIRFPSWNRSRVSWLVRRVSLPTWILPLGRLYMDLRVEGLEHLRGVPGPVLFAANHQSHLDTPAIMMAMPGVWRYRLATAMAKEFFTAHFHPAGRPVSRRLKETTLYLLSCQFFNTFPLPQREAGTRQTLRYVGEVAADGYSVLIFPEGRRTETGHIDRFQPGVGMIGARLGLPVVPVRIDGLDTVLGKGMTWPVRGRVRVAFGPPVRLEGEDYAGLAGQVEAAVRAL